jgi:hypothetical protein
VRSCVAAAAVLMVPSLSDAQDQSALRRQATPVAPSSSIGPVSDLSTFSVLGLAPLPDGDAASVTQRDVLWLGATQPVGRLGGVKFTGIGTGYWRSRDAMGSNGSVEYTVALRALGRVSGVRMWSAISFGRADASGSLAGLAGSPLDNRIGLDAGSRVDTTISRRVDIGTLGRLEAGAFAASHGVEMSLGLSVERATRVTTQTMRIEEIQNLPLWPAKSALNATTTTLRTLQRREIATGIASLSWNTGRTGWLASVTSPVAAWITRDAFAPRPRLAPAVASLAVVQPITAWLSAVAAASTNAATVGNTALRDDYALTRRRDFAPVLALGVRISQLPFGGNGGGGGDALGGVLGFETHIVTVNGATMAVQPDSAGATYRVQLVIDAPRATSVEVMGDATAWTITNMSRGRDGKWRTEMNIEPGLHRLSMRTDGGDWIAPPGLPVGNDDFGAPVGMLILQRPPIRR